MKTLKKVGWRKLTDSDLPRKTQDCKQHYRHPNQSSTCTEKRTLCGYVIPKHANSTDGKGGKDFCARCTKMAKKAGLI